jgi:protein-tyrosine sulfotransferase
LKSPIFIVGCHKSGTSLLRALLDGHPDVFVVPFEMQFFRTCNYWSQYSLNRRLPTNTLSSMDSMKDEITELVEKVSENKEQNMGDSAMFGKMNLSSFKESLYSDNIEGKWPTNLFEQYVNSIHQAIYDSPCEKRLVEKSVGNEEFITELVKMFPDAKFIHVLRNPYSNLVSLRYYAMRGTSWYPRLMPLMQAIESSYYFYFKNCRLTDNYFLVEYEELLEHPERMIRTIADIIGIGFQDSLLLPSTLGEPWKGNSSRGLEFTGIDKENMSRWKNEVTALELAYVNKSIPFVFDFAGYERIPTRNYMFPNWNEGIRTYLANRVDLKLSWRRGR